MNKLIILMTILLPISALANNTQNTFNNNSVMPTLTQLRNMDWTWKNIAKLPHISALEQDSEHKTYMQTQNIREENPQITITFYGTKSKPEVAVIESRTWGMGNAQNSQFVRLDMLKGNIPLQSNCNFRKISVNEIGEDNDIGRYETGADLLFQQFYRLPKDIVSLAPAKHDLYASSLQIKSYVTTSTFQSQAYTITIITPDQTKLGKYVTMYGWNTTKQGKKIMCRIQS